MSKHMRFVVTVLFAVILLLTAAITRFYSDTGKSTGGGKNQVDVEKKLAGDNAGNRIFEDSNGLYGVIDSNERVVIKPEWLKLSFAGRDLCFASKMLNGKLMTGCIDLEGNVAVPMIYRDIIKQGSSGFSFYTAYSAADNSCVLYDEEMFPMFTRAWESCTVIGNEMELTGEHGTYIYSLGSKGMTLKNAVLTGSAADCGYELKSSNETMLAALDPDMLDQISVSAGRYLEYAFTGNREYLSDVRSEERSAFSVIFPEDNTLLSKKLTRINSMVIYSTEGDDGKVHYIVIASVGAEILYADDEDKPHTLNGVYSAIIEFCGSNSNDLAAVSGSFIQKTPGYPEPASDENKSDEPEKNDA